jgi:hypothetical protein
MFLKGSSGNTILRGWMVQNSSLWQRSRRNGLFGLFLSGGIPTPTRRIHAGENARHLQG